MTGITLVAVAVALAVPGAAGASRGSTLDQRDVGTRLDLKALGHADGGGLVVHTAETYAPFPDQWATFKWGMDLNSDEAFDLVVFTEWRGGKLVGGVKDAAGRDIAPATVARPQPTVIEVSVPTAVLGGAAEYRYAVNAESDLDGDGPADPGERDLAPNIGLVRHRLGNVVEPGSAGTRTATAAPAPAPDPKPAPAAAPAPDSAPLPAAAPARPARADAPAPVAAAPEAPPKAPAANLPLTGPEDRRLLPWAGAGLIAGGALVALGAQRKRIHRTVNTGGNR